jgi:hypothetical protein
MNRPRSLLTGPAAGRVRAFGRPCGTELGMLMVLIPWGLLRLVLVMGALWLAASAVQAHKASDAYLFAEPAREGSRLRWDIALRDLDAALPIDADGDRQLTWGEVRAAWPAIDTLALGALAVRDCRFSIDGHALEQRQDGAYAVLLLSTRCPIGAATPVRYTLFGDVDPTHRGILRVRQAAGRDTVRVLNPTSPEAVGAAGGPAQSAASFLREGVHHIVTGYDHLLFLLCLLLPAVLRREDGRWHAVTSWRAALWPVAKTVTLFTLAHSVTLALVTLGWLRLPASIIEPAIAVTIMLAALDNIRPLIRHGRGPVTFLFGLIHGFGFAGVLSELELPPAALGWALFQFNLGLELGQLAMVLLVVPVLYLLRQRTLYVPGVMVTGSLGSIMLAGLWLVERTADVSLLPF